MEILIFVIKVSLGCGLASLHRCAVAILLVRIEYQGIDFYLRPARLIERICFSLPWQEKLYFFSHAPSFLSHRSISAEAILPAPMARIIVAPPMVISLSSRMPLF